MDHLSMARLRDQFNSQDKILKALADADYAGRRIRHSCHFEAAAEEIGMSRIDGGISMVWILATAKGRARDLESLTPSRARIVAVQEAPMGQD